MKFATPLVSVIVPNYNHEKYLVQRLESIFNQTYSNIEIILLDDCSRDNSQVILLEYAKKAKVSHCIINNENSGSPFKQWKKGIDLAKGDYIWIAESDDYCSLDFISKLMNSLVRDLSIGIGYCQTNDVDEKGRFLYDRINYTKLFQPNIWGKEFLRDGVGFIESYLIYFNVIPNASAVIFKKELVDESVFSDSLLNMKICGDWCFWIKIILKTKIFFLPETLNYFRDHQAVSRNHYSIEKKKLRLLEEKEIRSFVMQMAKINNLKSEQQLYLKWFKLHSVKDILFKVFYAIKLEQTTIRSFLLIYIRFRFRRWMKKMEIND